MKREKMVHLLIMMLVLSAFAGSIPVVAIAGEPPVVTNPSANPSSIPADGNTVSRLNVTVTDDTAVDTVTVDLTQIGGMIRTTMTHVGDNVYSMVTTAAVETVSGVYSLPVNATDVEGLSNTAVAIQLEVTTPGKGDINGNGKVDINDAIYLAKHVAGWSGYEVIKANGDINCDGNVNINDAIYLAKHVAGWSGYEKIC
jgi:hypothetical protein